MLVHPFLKENIEFNDWESVFKWATYEIKNRGNEEFSIFWVNDQSTAEHALSAVQSRKHTDKPPLVI